MNILLITQKVNKDDSYFGFFHGWVKIFADVFDKVTVITLEEGSHDLPGNVTILSLGKEKGNSRLKYIYLYFKYIWMKRSQYDVVFAHMSPWYAILGGPFWRLSKKPIGLWYVHRHADFKLRLATFFANIIFTATKESFTIPSKKVNYMGQAVDLNSFKPSSGQVKSDAFTIMTVGRITEIKKLHILLESFSRVKKDFPYLQLQILGEAVTNQDNIYKQKLLKQVEDLGIKENVAFAGAVKNIELPQWYGKAQLFMNLSPTGGLDKAVLESMACKIPVLVSNKAFRSYFGDFESDCLFEEEDVDSCTEKIRNLVQMNPQKREKIADFVYSMVSQKSSLDSLIRCIKEIFETYNK